MHCFNLKAEQKFDPKKHVERVLGRVAEGDVTIACWEPGQTSPYHCHPHATEIYFCFEVARKISRISAISDGESMSERDKDGYGFAPEHDAPIAYMQRIRDYYEALGYGAPYRWAHYAEVPFAPLKQKLAGSRIGLVTTAAPYQEGKGDQGPGAPYNAAAKFYTVYSGDSAQDHDLRISHIGYDRAHTTAEDQNSWFPLPALRRLAAAGRIGEVAPRFHGAPTNRSHRTTLDQDCPELLRRCREDRIDAVVLAAV